MIPFDRQAVLDLVYQSDTRLTARQFIHTITSEFCVSTREAKRIVQHLVNENELTYHYLYGNTYIEKSFLRPVKISDNFILAPPQMAASLKDARFSVIIEPGISFGSGQHPTTRMCLWAIDLVFLSDFLTHAPVFSSGADIGAGSGVLALAMCRAGLKQCRAYEIDPVSVREAQKNIRHNRLDHCIELIEDYIPPQPGPFSVICANLRYPTLMNLSELIHSSLENNGIFILSGMRPWEVGALKKKYSAKGFTVIHEDEQQNWSCLVLIKSGF